MKRAALSSAMLPGAIVLCVSGWLARAAADAPPDRYTLAQGLVTDNRTGLVWQQPASTSFYTWDQARTYCQALRLGTSSGFRVPSLKELMTLVDPTRRMPALDSKAFPSTPTEWFWSSSNRAASGPAAVSFASGGTAYYRASDALRVRCVR
jgi:hypothetical protein